MMVYFCRHKELALVATLAVGVFSPAGAQDGAALNPMRAIGKASLKSFLDRPLFDPSRRITSIAPRPVAVQMPTSDEPPPTLHLLGVIHGNRDIAIVQHEGHAKTIILRTGDHVGDWIVTVVPPLSVRLRNGNRAFDYALFTKPGAVGARSFEPAPTAIGQTDAIGMPDVMPSSVWQTSPN